MLIRSPEGPEGDWTAAELCKPAFELRLGGIMGKTAQVQHFAPLGQEGTNVRSRIHGAGQDLGVLVRGLRLANQAAEDAGQRNGFLHGPSWRCWGERLQVEGEVVFDGGGGLDGFNFEGGTDVGEGAGTEG